MGRPPNLETIARELGISRPRVSQLKAKGMPVHSAQAAREWRAQHITPPIVAGQPAPDAPEPMRSVTYDIAEARARREHHEANISAMREAQLAEALVSAERVRLALTSFAAEVRNAFERLPDKLTGPLAAESSADTVHATMTAAIGEVLEDVAKGIADMQLTTGSDDRH